MKPIYVPTGKAREYGELATNVHLGCNHGCTYCYGPAALRTDKANYAKPQLRPGYLEALDKQAAELHVIRSLTGEMTPPVFLSFACDPYSPFNDIHKITRQAIDVLHKHGLRVTVLTKGGHRALQDLSRFGPGDSFGATLTFLDPVRSFEWEPNAAAPEDRMTTLKKFHEAGVRTWASMEPVIDPWQTLELIKGTSDYVDHYKVGKLNHHPLAKEIDWPRFRRDVIELLDSLGKDYYIKQSLRDAK